MSRTRLLVVLVAVAGLAVPVTRPAPALAESPGQMGGITVPGAPLSQFDISYFDALGGTYYLADRSHAQVDVVAGGEHPRLRRPIGAGLFTGWNGDHTVAGPDGVTVVRGWEREEVWAADGNSTLKVFDLESGRLETTISTGGSKRADEMVFDAPDQLLVVANDSDSPPYLSFVSTAQRRV